jgi:hypothetical protein
MFEKYEQIAFLRAAEAAGTLPDPAPVARALATRFPGALRELDEMPPDELARTLALLASSEPLNASEIQRFRALDAYHEALRGLLEVKRWLAGDRALSAPKLSSFHEKSDWTPAARSWVPWLATIARPAGRLADLAISRVAQRLEITEEKAWSLVAPRREDKRLARLRRGG